MWYISETHGEREAAMSRQHVEVRARSSATPAAVFALASDRPTWPSWSPIDSFELEKPGHPDRQGVGAIGALRTGKRTMREKVVEVVPDKRFGYELVSGLAIRDYRANVDLEPAANGGTEIRWSASFVPKVPGTGRLYRKALTGALGKYASALAAASSSSAPAP